MATTTGSRAATIEEAEAIGRECGEAALEQASDDSGPGLTPQSGDYEYLDAQIPNDGDRDTEIQRAFERGYRAAVEAATT